MSQSVRHSNLFAGEDFTKIYKSFQQIDFTSYDYNTIKTSLIEYIRQNYPENFNDYIESSEYIAIIELIAYLGTSLALRVDINSRENFIDTAQRKESVIRLARMLSYAPKRNYPASGLFKIIGVRTTETVFDSMNRNLSNVIINWNDTNNTDSYEQFLTIMNASMSSSNRFGDPAKRGTIGGVLSELYTLNNTQITDVVYPTSVVIDGETLPFDVVNADLEDNQVFFERQPNPADRFNVIYRNDNLGPQSANSGFFLLFKQGKMQHIDYQFDLPVENRVIELTQTNINETDVFVQEVNAAGEVQTQWKQIPNIEGSNIIFNAVSLSERNVFSVDGAFDDQVKIKFADGNFGNIPTGIFRVWIRQSANKRFTMRPELVGTKSIDIPYVDVNNKTQLLTLYFTLVSTVENSTPSETIQDVKERAPQVFYTQDRMVNNEDYGVFPLSRANEIIKVRSINRTYAGHSRYIDVNDPTGFHKDLTIYGDDGFVYSEDFKNTLSYELYDVSSTSRLLSDILPEFMGNINLTNFFYGTYITNYSEIYKDLTNTTHSPFAISEIARQGGTVSMYWKTQPTIFESTKGYFVKVGSGVTSPTDAITNNKYVNLTNNAYRYIRSGSKIKTVSTVLHQINGLINEGTPYENSFEDGPISTTTELKEYEEIKEVIPFFRSQLTNAEVDMMRVLIDNRQSFQIGYSIDTDTWYTLNVDNFDENSSGFNDFTTISSMNPEATDSPATVYPQMDQTKSWLITFRYRSSSETGSAERYDLTSRGTRYVFESYSDVRFFTDTTVKSYDTTTGKFLYDTVSLLPNNRKQNTKEIWFRNDSDFKWFSEDNSYIYPQGYIFLNSRQSQPLTITLNGTIDIMSLYRVGGYIDFSIPINGSVWVPNATDYVEVTYANEELLGETVSWETVKPILMEDGYNDQRRIEIIPSDNDQDGIYDSPFIFEDFVSASDIIIMRNLNDGLDDYIAPFLGNMIEMTGSVSVYNASTLTMADGFGSESIVDNELIVFGSVAIFDGFLNTIKLISNQTERELYLQNLVSNKIIMFKDTLSFYTLVLPLDSLNFNSAEILVAEPSFFTRVGRGTGQSTSTSLRTFGFNRKFDTDKIYFLWRHYCSPENRIDPSISNIIDMYVLTNTYYQQMLVWKNERKQNKIMPVEPSSEELRIQFLPTFNEYKMLSDQIVMHSGRFKVLFGSEADTALQAKFKIVKNAFTNANDNEIKAKVIEAIDLYFDVYNWDFGEQFYFTELSSFIHRQLSSMISSVVITPKMENSAFGDLFQISAEPDELFISTAKVTDIEIINTLTDVNLRVKR